MGDKYTEIKPNQRYGNIYKSIDNLDKKYKISKETEENSVKSKTYVDNNGKKVATVHEKYTSGSIRHYGSVTIFDHNSNTNYSGSLNTTGNSMFSKIETSNYYAIDTNRDGVVQENEIHKK